MAYLIEGLLEKELTQTVFCFKNSEIEKYCITKNVATLTHKKTTAFNPLLLQQLANKCRSLSIDLIHAHDSHAHTMAVLSGVLFRHKAKIILSRKVDFPIKNNFFSRYKYKHPSIKKIICVSQKIKEILSKDIQNKSVLTTVYDGIDFSRFGFTSTGILRKTFSIAADELIIGNIAAIASHKDYFTFINVAEILISAKLKAKFLIVGDGPDKKKIADYISKKGLNNEIKITGFRTDIPAILPEFDVFLFTSKTEGLGSSLLDAYACGVPVVTTKAGGIPEIVIHNKTGLLSPPQNAELLAANVIRVLENNAFKTELIQNAKIWVKNFSKEKNAELTYRIYKEVTA